MPHLVPWLSALLGCASSDTLRTEAALAAFVSASRVQDADGQEEIATDGASGNCHHGEVEVVAPDPACACTSDCPTRYTATLLCVGTAWAGPWEGGGQLNRLEGDLDADDDDFDAPVPSSLFDEADLVLHATRVGSHLPLEVSCDESARGDETWTGEAFVDGVYHAFVVDSEFGWGFERWSVALDEQSAVAWEVYSGSR